MENNNTPRKARIYYSGAIIPVLVVDESDHSYSLLLDWKKLSDEATKHNERVYQRDLYLDALFGYEGAHTVHDHVTTSRTSLTLDKYNPDVTLVFDKPEPEEAQAVPVDDPGIDNTPAPPIDSNAELDQQLNLMKSLGYKVKSFEAGIQEGGEALLWATFTKEVDK